ncbi:hypothetical protein JQM97_14960, partial [Prevotella hominis]|nr:hypothetical protein [Segatella hominis]
MAEEPKFEVIDGFRYLLDSDTKTATLFPKREGKYSGDIIIPEKVKGNDGVEYVVTSLGASCFEDCSGLTSITIPSSVTSLGASNPQPIGFSGILLAKRQNSFYCT